MRTSILVARAFALLAAIGFPAALSAQAPVVTPQGDPSVRSDTIYRLAVDTADYPDQSVAVLLDDAIIRLDSTGRGTRTYRMVIQILREDAVDGAREHSFGYSPGHQKFTINWIRVVKPDGTVISPAPTHEQDADVPARMGNPIYSDVKVKRVSLTGVEPGTIVDYSFTMEELNPYRERDFFETWSINGTVPVRRSRLIVDLPSAMKPNFYERNLPTPRVTKTVGDRTVYSWIATDLAPLKREPYAAVDSSAVLSYLFLSAPTTWNDIASWYAGYADSRYTGSPALAQKVADLTSKSKTRTDSIRAIHRWVAQDIRYVSLALGLGSYQPRMPDSVIATGYGDCKDKTTLFITALKQIGIDAYPVLLNGSGRVQRQLPSYQQFDHVIVAVKGTNGYEFADLTIPTLPYGEVAGSLENEFGLVVLPGGKSQEITFPKSPIETNYDSTFVAVTLDTLGSVTGTYTNYTGGYSAQYDRASYDTPLDSTRRADIAESTANMYFENATGDSLMAFDGKDLQAIPRTQVKITSGKAATVAGDMMILTVPRGAGSYATSSADELKKAPPRKFHIDASRVFGQGVYVTDVSYTLPEGWRAKLPKNVHVDGLFGVYSAEYSQEGQTVRIRRTRMGREGIYPPDRIGELETWFRAVGEDNVKFIVLEKAE